MRTPRWSLGAHRTDENHRVTTMELLFDLVYVFAFIQVTTWIAQEHTLRATAEGLVMLAILWWVWVTWAWLGNVMRADRGLPLAGFIVAMVATFGIALTIQGIWDAEGGAVAPVAFAVLYTLVRAVHTAVYLHGVRGDDQLQRQVWLSTAAWVPAAVTLIVGALQAPEQRLYWWGATVVLEVVATWLLSVRGPGWKVSSGQHFAERFDLVVILALGESVLAVGITAAKLDFSGELLGIGLLGVLVAISLWWPYFKAVGPALEDALDDAPADRKPDLARDVYSYLHLPLIMGIILVAAGIEEAVVALEEEQASGGASVFLAVGAAVFAGTCAVLMRVAGGTWQWLAGTAAFFVVAAWWLPQVDATVAIILTVAVLSTVGWITPSARHREASAVDSSDHGEA
ncbi:low temperature requirement protein A [Demequina globuliformis]|uniref:low temperature requirement protein A n=1 Tax=Demequina globuliformis TaxID=676202 RepID=UPI00078655C7|nr:low temperature requirement protein A [Demequina globuliformis]